MSEANKDEGLKCLRIAQKALDAGDLDKARKFGEKAQQLYPSSQVEAFLRLVTAREPSSSQAGRPSASSSASPGHTTNPGMRARTTTARPSESSTAPKPDAGTPQQRALVASILSKASCYYDVLSISKTADEEEIKKAYRKLALKLHPDKCQANGAEEAFKLVSKAFTCLTDPDRRAYYDRTGHEDPAAAQAARRASGGAPGGGFYYHQEMDPADIFNMMFPGMGMGHMFGRGPMGMNRPFPNQHPFGPRAQQPRGEGARANAGFSGLINILPLIILLLVTFMANSPQPAVQLSPSREYREPLATVHKAVPFYVRDVDAFNERFPPGGVERRRLEGQIEVEYRNDLMDKCRAETTRNEHYKRSWSRSGKPLAELERPSCQRLERFLGRGVEPRFQTAY